MKTNTDKKILDFIQQKGQTTPKEIINYIGFGPPAIFRQLKKLLNQNLIQKTGTAPHVVYHQPMTNKEKKVQQAFKWTTASIDEILQDHDLYCPTRDIFQFRNEKMPKILLDGKIEESLAYLLTAIVGEIGNNSFDHNFGNWPDLPGIYFKIAFEEKMIILADRGQGIMATLKKALPDIADDQEALRVAFTKIISGRTPEKRGNGLKFVKKIIEQNNLILNFYSGTAVCLITPSSEMEIKEVKRKICGTMAIIEF